MKDVSIKSSGGCYYIVYYIDNVSYVYSNGKSFPYDVEKLNHLYDDERIDILGGRKRIWMGGFEYLSYNNIRDINIREKVFEYLGGGHDGDYIEEYEEF